MLKRADVRLLCPLYDAQMHRRRLVQAFAGIAGCAILGRAAGQAQPKYRLGYLNPNSPRVSPQTLGALLNGLKNAGLSSGVDFRLDERWAGGSPERLRAAAAELVSLAPNVIVASSTQAALAACQATRIIPVVFVNVSNPVDLGIVKTLREPGGNATGITTLGDELMSKLLELALALVPSLSRLGVLVNPDDSTTRQHLRNFETAAKPRAVRYDTHQVSRAADLKAVFDHLAKVGANLAIVTPQPVFFAAARDVAGASLASRVPAVSPYRELTEVGGLASYGSSISGNHVRAAALVAKILRGAQPAQLSVEQPTEYELALNRRTAAALRVAIPEQLLVRADAIVD